MALSLNLDGLKHLMPSSQVKVHQLARDAQTIFIDAFGGVSDELFYHGYLQGMSDLLESINKHVTIESKEKNNNGKKRNSRKTRRKQKTK